MNFKHFTLSTKELVLALIGVALLFTALAYAFFHENVVQPLYGSSIGNEEVTGDTLAALSNEKSCLPYEQDYMQALEAGDSDEVYYIGCGGLF